MATISDPRQSPIRINDDEPLRRTPPILVVGPLAWIRNNLFRTWFDSLLTIGATALVVTAAVSFLRWVVVEANWFALTFNLRQFLVGRYEVEAEWRAQVVVLLIAFVVGFALAAWARVSGRVVGIVIVLLALMYIIPAVAYPIVPPASMYVAAGSVEVVSGASKQTPPAQLGFVAKAGETVTVQVADNLSKSDAALAQLSSFADIASNLLLNAASNRLNSAARRDEINGLLAGTTLTQNQRDQLTAELGRLKDTPPVVDTYALNQATVSVRVLRGSTMQPIAQADLKAGDPPLSVTLPDDGWYVLDKSVKDNPKSVALLQTTGIYPLLQRDLAVSTSGSQPSGGRSQQYLRLTDGFLTTETRPQVNGKDVAMTVTIDHAYRGDRSFGDYLRVYLAPFLLIIRFPLLAIFVVAVVGYGASRLMDRAFANAERRAAPRVAMWLLVATPPLMFVLIYGVGDILLMTDTRRWGGLMLTVLIAMVAILLSFPLGILLALGRRSRLPVIKIASTIYIEFVRGVPFITILFMAQLLVPLINPSLAAVSNVFRAMIGAILFSAAYLAENVRGGLQAVSHGQEEAAKAIGLATWQIVVYITLPQALRAVIPALVGSFISLLIDTSLVAIVGLIDLTGIAQTVVAQTEFLGARREVFIFITAIYFLFAISMSRVSRRIETSGVGTVVKQEL